MVISDFAAALHVWEKHQLLGYSSLCKHKYDNSCKVFGYHESKLTSCIVFQKLSSCPVLFYDGLHKKFFFFWGDFFSSTCVVNNLCHVNCIYQGSVYLWRRLHIRHCMPPRGMPVILIAFTCIGNNVHHQRFFHAKVTT